ncbi:hemerythrin domain-containing protein [Wohlfahrtiimonas larvae]|uniref:Hemerythrin-like domain-containing protein n=1 Tax=Wohlfahrtiimonas larvae TaxID=1157986 RepID=A0ABP9MFI5_9GAMM|nr:hemerythrin domain-containing protein [Wohlfahrtiimonas larvae]
MKRDPRLIEFSREHHSALKLGLLIKNSDDLPLLIKEIKKAKGMLLNHFAEEETDLLSIMNEMNSPNLVAQFESDHKQLRAYLHQSELALDDVKAFGALLTSHSRFEEKELFQAIQAYWAETETGNQ